MTSRIPWALGPIAHRGLHDLSDGRVENAPAAIMAGVEAGFGIEIDLQLTSDDAAMVFHDFTLDRLTHEQGPVRARPRAELTRIAYTTAHDRIATFDAVLEMVNARVPLYVELKSDFSGDMTLAQSIAPAVNGYGGPLALMSFDPRMVKAASTLCPGVPCGLVSGRFDGPDWDPNAGGALQRFALRHMLTAVIARPAFINYDISAISQLAPQFFRRIGLPLLTWTVRTRQDREAAAKWADAMVFEGFLPEAGERLAA